MGGHLCFRPLSSPCFHDLVFLPCLSMCLAPSSAPSCIIQNATFFAFYQCLPRKIVCLCCHASTVERADGLLAVWTKESRPIMFVSRMFCETSRYDLGSRPVPWKKTK